MKRNRFRSLVMENIPLIFAWTLLILLVICVVSWNVKPIHAYLEDSDAAVNTIVIGDNEISVDEVFETPAAGKRTIKEPAAKNVGRTDCYVRGKVVESDSRIISYLTYYYGAQEGFNQQDWKIDRDGWMYYQNVLRIDEKTAPIFSHIELSESIPETLMDFSIDIVFESVQSRNFSDAKTAFAALENGGGI